MAKEIDINDIEQSGDIQFEEQKDLRPEDIKSIQAERSVLPNLVIKAGLAQSHKAANYILIAVSIVCFGVSVILFTVASSTAVDSTNIDRSPRIGDYLFATTTANTASSSQINK